MSQSPALAWDASPDNTSGVLADGNIGTAVAPPVVEVKIESFADKVEQTAAEQIRLIKETTDRERLNASVKTRVAELVKEYGLPPPKTEDETIDLLVQSKLDEFENQRLNFLAEKKAREVFFDRHPEMRTQEKKQNAPEVAQQMSAALLDAFLRFLGAEQQHAERMARREAAKKKD